MEWIDLKLRIWWVTLSLCWIAGMVFFSLKKDTREETKQYWKHLKSVLERTLFMLFMGVVLVVLPWQIIKYIVQFFRH